MVRCLVEVDVPCDVEPIRGEIKYLEIYCV